MVCVALLCATGCGTAGTDAVELTLDNCTTSVGSGVPDFFKRYFQCSTLSVSGTDVVIATQGLPPHRSAYYGKTSPNYVAFDTSRGSQYHQNPNTLAAQNVTVRVPLNPVSKNVTVTADLVDGHVNNALEYKMGPAGVALDGVLLFNPLAAPADDIENEKYTFDSYNAHPEMRGAYHYHTNSQGPLEVLKKLGLVTTTTPERAEVELYGIMCDGTVVLGCTELDGSAPDKTDFDAQDGHVRDLKAQDGTVLLAGRYHTHVCTGWTDKPRKFTPEIQHYQTCTAQ